MFFFEKKSGPADFYCTIEFMRVLRGAALYVRNFELCGGPVALMWHQLYVKAGRPLFVAVRQLHDYTVKGRLVINPARINRKVREKRCK